MAAKKKSTKKVAKKAKVNTKAKVVKTKTKAKPAKKAVKAKVKKAPAKKITKPTKKVKSVKKTAPVVKPLAAKPAVQIDYSKAITPLLDRLVVKVLTGERITAGGIIIPETASIATGYLKAKVLAIGSGIKTKKGSLRPLDVQVGDTVLFASFAGTKVEFNSEELEIIHETDVMGVVQE
jgi:chaperonin GroES